MTAKTTKYLCLAVISLYAFSVNSYELKTHARLTGLALDQSQLTTDATLLPSLGLSAKQARRLSETYYDISTPALGPIDRGVFQYEVDNGIDPDPKNQYDIRAWLQRGAIREDDAAGILRLKYPNPDDEPGGNFNRFCHHFFDPYRVRALSGGGFSSEVFCPSSGTNANRMGNEWATSPYTGWKAMVMQSQQYRNHFTIVHARELMWRALTLTQMNVSASGYMPLPGVATNTPQQNETERLRYWASTFKALGNVVHMIQDAAQPQHSRNEEHPGGAFEFYIETRMEPQTFKRWTGVLNHGFVEATIPAIAIGAYPVPAFRDYNSYWTTGSGPAVISSGRGISDYSNRGFLTEKNSLGDTEYPSPNPDVSAYETKDETRSTDASACDFNESATPASFRYLLADVKDFATHGQIQKIRMASAGLLDKHLQAKSATVRSYSFNKCTMDDRASILLPRAVGYSAGVINHFFRGKMEIKLPADGVFAIVDHADTLNNCKDDCGFKKLKAIIKNVTPPIVESGTATSYSQDMTNGDLVAIARFHRNTCYLPDLTGEWVQETATELGPGQFNRTYTNQWQVCRSSVEEVLVSRPVSGVNLAANAENSFSFDFETAIPINATDLYLQIAYRGKLGDEEDAVAVQTIDISEPNYLVFANGASPATPVNFGGTATASCVPFDGVAAGTGGPSPWCRVAYLMGTENYSSAWPVECPSSRLRPAVAQVDKVTGAYAEFPELTMATNIWGSRLIPSAAGRFHVARCDNLDGTGRLVVLTDGMKFGRNDTTGGQTVNLSLPPVKVQQLNF